MNILKRKSGFTLIEIIIVIVIIGVLASLALPRLTVQITNAQATEAITVLGKFARAVDQCYQVREAFGECDQMEEVRDFTFSDNFTYSLTAAAPNVRIQATRGAVANDSLTFTINTVTGAITKSVSTAGVYKGLKLR